MLLTIDIGSSNITLGLFEQGALRHTFRLQSRRDQTSDEYALALRQLAALAALSPEQVSESIIASVVPASTQVLASALRRAFGHEPFVVRADTDMGLVLAVDRPLEVGVDRLVNVVAARAQLSAAGNAACGVIVVDLGTATTLDCASPGGEFVGGVIVPGMRVSFDALVARTAKLPDVELVAPGRVLGNNTVHCLQSGIVYGYASLIDGLVAKLRAELPFACHVLATGGLASVVAPHATSIERVDSDLTLRGLLFIHERALVAADPR
jgi:type III pantothenate kinase